MTKKIRVLYTIPNFNTAGSGKSVYDLVKGLDRSIFEPEICCFHNKGAFFKEVEELGVKIHLFPFTAKYRPWFTFLYRVLKIRRFFKKHQFDLIHSWHWSSDISEPFAAKLAGIPYVYTKKAMGWGNRYWKWRSQLSSKVIVVNEDMITSYFYKMKAKIANFPLAINTNHYLRVKQEDDLKQKLGLNANDFVIISVANLVPVKGMELLLDAIQKLNDKTVKTLVVGNDTNEYGIALKDQYSSNTNIIFLGKQLDVRPYLALSDLFVIPTKDEGRKEGIPNAPLEAMAMECVVIGSKISGITDILKSFPDCLFQPGDRQAIFDKIIEIKSMSIRERKKLGYQMREEVVKHFSIEGFIHNHQSLYLELL
jgi:glycosyltransferase involved in cell wall biosynthesis